MPCRKARADFATFAKATGKLAQPLHPLQWHADHGDCARALVDACPLLAAALSDPVLAGALLELHYSDNAGMWGRGAAAVRGAALQGQQQRPAAPPLRHSARARHPLPSPPFAARLCAPAARMR